jgi:hypothetical protein
MLLELIEGRVERAKRVAEEAVVGFSRRPGRICRDGVGALVVRDRYRAARDIIFALGVRQGDGTRTQAGHQQERDTGTADPRQTAEHQVELNDKAVLRQELVDCKIGRLADYGFEQEIKRIGGQGSTHIAAFSRVRL